MKIDENLLILAENFFISSEHLRKFNEIFKKDVSKDNIKSHKKPRFHLLFRRHIFRKTTGGQFDPPQPF